MLKTILLSVSILFFVSCGGNNNTTKEDHNTSSDTIKTPIAEEALVLPVESIPTELTSLEKVTKEAKTLNLLVLPVDGVVDVISGKNKISFNKELYVLQDNTNQQAVISIDSSTVEELETKEGLVMKSQDIRLPNFNKGYHNIFIDTNSTDTKIKEELMLLFEEGGVPVMSYTPSDLEKNTTIKIEGESNLFNCSNNNQNYEIVAQEGLLTLPSDANGHYICLDQYDNEAFDYNVSIEEIEEVKGSLYTYDPKKERGALVKIYDMIYEQVNIEEMEKRFRESGLLSENGSLELEIFYKNSTSTEEPIKAIKGKQYLLEAGTYLLSFLMTSPQNENINQGGDLSSLQIISEINKVVITVN